MKKISTLLIIIFCLILLVGCNNNFTYIDLSEPVSIPDNGIIEKEVFDQIKKENKIAIFTNTYNEYYYEWTIFGTDIKDTKDVNLLIEITEYEEGIQVLFIEDSSFGFQSLLSIHLNEKWNVDTAVVYYEDQTTTNISLTGNKKSIINLSVDENVKNCTILPKASEVVDDNPNRPSSDGTSTNQDKYNTDPVPQGKPLPVNPEDQVIDGGKIYICTISIECSTIINNLSDLDPNKLELVPSNGIILAPIKVEFYDGESVFDVLKRVCKEKNIHLEFSWTPIYNSAYIEGINNLYEFDCGNLSGWMYRVNGWYPNYGCSRYKLVDGEVIEWRFTCDLGKDIGCDWME